MRVLPGVVKQRRQRLAGVALVVVAAAALAGCAQFDKALGQREAVVTFQSGTPVSQRLAVRSTCVKIPAVTAPPLPSDLSSPYALQQLVFRIDHASDADVARLETCLDRFPGVAGVTLQDTSDAGG
jgi:hypothetical protein